MTVHEQRMAALELANEIRAAKVNVRRTIAAVPGPTGREHAARILENPTSLTGALTVGKLLTSVQGIGRSKAITLIRAIEAHSLDRHVRDLTGRQRRELAKLLREGGWRSHAVNSRLYAREKGLVA